MEAKIKDVNDVLKHHGVQNASSDDSLSHYGILGMKWGVRRSDRQLREARKAEGRIRKAKKSDDSVSVRRVDGEDGEEYFDRKGRRISKDAATAAALKNRAKREGPQSLSNEQMQDLIKRMQLDNSYSKLNPKEQSAVKKFAISLLKDVGKQAAKELSSKYSKQLADAIFAASEAKKKK